MKKILRSLLCVLLVAAMTATTTLQALAAGTAEYVSEIKMAICDSLADAKKELSGYIVLESDLNAGQGNGAQSVYLGYKTTTDKSKAITDLRLMDMNGGYSYCDYDKALESRLSAIKTEIDSFIDAVKEFQKNYNAGKSNAVYAYQQMNMYKDDDTNQLIGDIFLNEAITSDDLTTIFLQGNTASVSAIEQYLAIACADNWVERLGENVRKVYDADAFVLEPYCELIRLQWEDFYNGLTDFEEQLDSDNPYDMTEYTEESYNEWLATNPTEETQYYVASYSAAYRILESYSYRGGTLLDYFMVPLDEVDYEYLYPIADAMTKGQIQTLSFISLYSAVAYAETEFDVWVPAVESENEALEKIALEYLEETVESENGVEVTGVGSVVSVYEGVDRSLFMKDNGVALTNDALRQMNSSDDPSAVAQIFNNCKISLSICAAVSAALVVGTAIATGLSSTAVTNASLALEQAENMFRGSVSLTEKYLTGPNIAEASANLSSAKSTLTMCKVGLGVAIGIMLISIGISIYTGYYKYMNPDYKTVPRAIVDEQTETVYNSYGVEVGTKSFYYAYYPVEDAKPDGAHGDYADMNGWKAQQWNVMYYTRDSRVGAPILADSFVVQYGNSTRPEGYTAFCEFGVAAAADLNKHAFKEVQGIYLFYKTAEATPVGLASVFSNGYYALTALCGLAVGAGAMLAVGAILNKKRSKKDIPAEV